MVCCAVSNCKNTSVKTSKNKDGITFHRFPRDKERRRQWERAMNREEEWRSSPFSAVCSEHFGCTDFYLTDSGLRRLSVNAVPCINISPCQEPVPTISRLPPVYIDPSDTEEVIKLKNKVRRLEMIAESRKHKLNLVWQSRRRLKKKLECMKCMVNHLIKIKDSTSLAEQYNCEVSH